MSSTTKVKVGKTLLIRAAHDFAPKVVAAALAGISATAVMSFLHLFGITVDQGFASLVAVFIALLAAYIKADTPLLGQIQAAYDALPADQKGDGSSALDQLSTIVNNYSPPPGETPTTPVKVVASA